ncbi:MAG: FAD:protein FMN transferase [Candidatus Egerieousia sp.]
MEKNLIIFVTVVIATVSTLCGCTEKPKSPLRTLDGVTQGTTYHIVFEPVVNNDSCFTAVRDSVAVYLKQIDDALSGYNKSSLLSAFNDNSLDKDEYRTVAGSGDLRKIFADNFSASKEMFEKSDGLFDASAAPLFDMWGFGFRNKTEVTQKQIDSVMHFVGMHHFTIGKDGMPTKDDPRCKLNFNAIAQGYTADYIAEKFVLMGMDSFLIEVGGEIYAKGVKPDKTPWKVGIDRPEDNNNDPGAHIEAIIKITDKGLVTSGDYRKFYMKEGKKVSHTINPKNGKPVEHNLLSATVMAKDATTADAYATYLMVLGFDKAKAVVENNEEIEALLIYGDNEQMKTWVSEGLKSAVSE